MSFAHFNDNEPISSPRSLLICRRHGVDPGELFPLTEVEEIARFERLPPSLRDQAAYALEQDRQRLVSQLQAEYAEFSIAKITPAEFAAFPELGKLAVQAEEPAEEVHELDVYVTKARNDSLEYRYVRNTVIRQRGAFRGQEEKEREIAQRRKHELELREQEREEKIASCRRHVRATSEARERELREKNQEREQRALALHEQEEEQRIAKLRHAMDSYASHLERVEQEELERSAHEEAEKLRTQALQEKPYEPRRRSESAAQSSTAHSEIYEERERQALAKLEYAREERELIKNEWEEEFEESLARQQQNLQEAQARIASRNAAVISRHNLRYQKVLENKSEAEQMLQNQLLQEELLLEQKQGGYSELVAERRLGALTQQAIQDEIRERRIKRQQQMTEFEREMMAQNAELHEQWKQQRDRAANEHRERMLQKYEERKERYMQHHELIQEKRAKLNDNYIVEERASGNAQYSACRELAEDYLTDQQTMRKGFVNCNPFI